MTASDADEIATSEEVLAAINELSDRDWLRMKKYAEYKAYPGLLSGADDLMQEALTRVLEERRSWKKNRVDFVRFLCGVIRSISDEEYKKLIDARDGRKDLPEPIEVSVEDRFLALEECESVIDEMKRRFAEDEGALKILEAFEACMTRVEAREYSCLNKVDFDTKTQQIEGYFNGVLKQKLQEGDL